VPAGQLKDDAYLQVVVSSGSPAAVLYVEVAGNDGMSHASDVVTVARAILTSLG
jgi:hypothetical protein